MKSLILVFFIGIFLPKYTYGQNPNYPLDNSNTTIYSEIVGDNNNAVRFSNDTFYVNSSTHYLHKYFNFESSEDSIINISDTIISAMDDVKFCQNNHIISIDRVNKTFSTIINENRTIDEYDYNTFINDTGPKMKEHLQYKTGLLVEITNLFQIIYLKFIKYVDECNLKEELIMSIYNDLNILIQNITFYQSI